jgi:hypothetical protein
MNSIIISIKGIDYTIKQSFRSYLLYEEMTQKQISEIETMKDILTLLYCTFKGCNKIFTFTFDEYIDFIDDDPTILTRFNEFNTTLLTEQTEKKK